MDAPSRAPSHLDSHAPSHADAEIIADTRAWLEKAVIGLNLCPFAKAVYVKDQVRFQVSDARTEEALIEELARELETLAEAKPEKIDTTLLIHPHVLQDFADYNQFLDLADALIVSLQLDGILQVASFHPDYQFADTAADDITNFSNRSPYPTLHLLREESIDRAVEAFPEADAIYDTNMRTLKALGIAGWRKLGIKPTRN